MLRRIISSVCNAGAPGSRPHSCGSSGDSCAATMLPLGTSASPLEKDFRYENGDLPKAIRVTTDREFFEMHSDSVEFWTPGSPAFAELAPYRDRPSAVLVITHTGRKSPDHSGAVERSILPL